MMFIHGFLAQISLLKEISNLKWLPGKIKKIKLSWTFLWCGQPLRVVFRNQNGAQAFFVLFCEQKGLWVGVLSQRYQIPVERHCSRSLLPGLSDYKSVVLNPHYGKVRVCLLLAFLSCRSMSHFKAQFLATGENCYPDFTGGAIRYDLDKQFSPGASKTWGGTGENIHSDLSNSLPNVRHIRYIGPDKLLAL